MAGLDLLVVATLVIASAGLGLAILDFLYTWYTQRTKGPNIVVSEVYLRHKHENMLPVALQNVVEKKTYCDVMIVVQNIGDWPSLLRLDDVRIIVEMGDQTFENSSDKKTFRFPLKVGAQFAVLEKVMSFILPITALGDWTRAKLSLKGKFFTHKEKLSPFSKDYEIDNINEPRGA